MSETIGAFLFGVSLTGMTTVLIMAATIKTFAAAIAEARQVNQEGQAILQDMKLEQRRIRDNDADYWKYEHFNENEEEGDDWNS